MIFLTIIFYDDAPTFTSPYACIFSQIRRSEVSRSPPAVLKAAASIVSGAPKTTSGAPYSGQRIACSNVNPPTACTGTFTTDSRRAGEFSLRCFDGQFSAKGNYERKAGDRIDSFVARGRTEQGLPIMLVVGKPAGISEDQFLSP